MPAGERTGPTQARRAAPLTRREKVRVAAAALAPIALGLVILVPIALVTSITVPDAVAAAVVYGGLFGLAGGFVATDRLQARQCPRCRRRGTRGNEVCTACGYDLEHRPRFACSDRHHAYLDVDGDGRCACGRQLEPLPAPRGVGPQVVATLKIGGSLLVFLLAVGTLLNVLEGRLRPRAATSSRGQRSEVRPAGGSPVVARSPRCTNPRPARAERHRPRVAVRDR